MNQSLRLLLLSTIISVALMSNASAEFDVNWGKSKDTGNLGYKDLGTWFKNNGYAADQASGENFAKTGYVGYNGADADPFTWSAAPSVTFDVVQQMAGNADLTKFGYYTGTGAGKSLTQVLGLNQTGPTTVSAGGPFGLYLNTPTTWRGSVYADWFTGRAENSNSSPQGLIYRLNSQSWLIAWEDLDVTNVNPRYGSDRDYNDAYLKLTVAPEPMSMALFGLGAGVLGLVSIRRKKKSL